MDDTGVNARAFAEALGAEIGYWRKRRSMTRGDLARAAGISETTMGRIEREGPKDVADSWRLASALGISFSALVERAEQAARMSTLDLTGAGMSDEDRTALRRGVREPVEQFKSEGAGADDPSGETA